MGVIKPPWVDRFWFARCPFNYCDHFGDQKILASVCRVCKDDVFRKRMYKKAEINPYDTQYVLNDIADVFTQLRTRLQKDAERMGIDLNNLPPNDREEPNLETYPIYKLVSKYGDNIEIILRQLFDSPYADKVFVIKAMQVLTHSRHYVAAKISRAISSRFEEEQDPEDDLDDSKTSAFFAYIAITRNARALNALSQKKALKSFIKSMTELKQISEELAVVIQKEFFPNDELAYEEFGCDSYNMLFP